MSHWVKVEMITGPLCGPIDEIAATHSSLGKQQSGLRTVI